MEKHVTNLDISRKLFELGIKQESEFYWVEFKYHEWDIFPASAHSKHNSNRACSAFLASELGELLPGSIEFTQKTIASTIGKKGFRIWKTRSQFKDGLTSWHMGYIDRPETVVEERTMPDSMGKMLIYLLENNLIKD